MNKNKNNIIITFNTNNSLIKQINNKIQHFRNNNNNDLKFPGTYLQTKM